MRELSEFGILPCRSAEFNYVSAPGYQVFMQIRQLQKGYDDHLRPCHVLAILGIRTIGGSLAPALWRVTYCDHLSVASRIRMND